MRYISIQNSVYIFGADDYTSIYKLYPSFERFAQTLMDPVVHHCLSGINNMVFIAGGMHPVTKEIKN